MPYKQEKFFTFLFLMTIKISFLVQASFSFQLSRSILASGTITYWPRVDVRINVNKIIGINNLSLGFHLDHSSWIGFLKYPARQQLARDANFKLIRVFDFRQTNPRLMPCLYWNESSKSGVWDWTNVDALTQKIFEVGAEPLFCLGWARDNIQKYIPPGMEVNPVTQLPFPESYAAYAAEWVKHFKELGFPVRYYQIMNEPATYFGWSPINRTKLSYYVQLWNTVARAMRSINPDVRLSHDCITRKGVLEYWIQYGDDVDFLDFHKYDHYGNEGWPPLDDATILARAESICFETSLTLWGVEEARQMWYTARGRWLPVINSESNLNSYYETGTDPRIQQMVGAVWTAIVLRTGVLKGLRYNVYYEFSSSKSYGETTETGGYGFGMINSDNNKPWYPYYVHYIFGNSLSDGDLLVESDSSSDDLKVLAWIHNQKLNVLIICKVDQPRTVYLYGLKGQINISRIDNTVPWETPNLQKEVIDDNAPITLNGYTVALLQTELSTKF